MLDSEPLDIEEPSETDKGGVSAPELDVHVPERGRIAGPGREKIDCERTYNNKIVNDHAFVCNRTLTCIEQVLAMRHDGTIFQALSFQETLTSHDHPFSTELVRRRRSN